EQEITKLRTRVQEAEAAVAQYRIRNDLFVGSNQTSLPDQQLSTISDQINAAQERKNNAASRAALIRSVLASGQPIDGVTDIRANPIIAQLTQNRADLQAELAQRSATLLDSHPTMQALRAQIGEVNAQIAAEARRVATGLDAEAQVEGDIEASLRDDLARVKITASTATESTVQLDALEREARAQRDLLESYLGRYREALSRTESNSILPDVRVVTIAAPSVTPASPKTGLTLGAVAFVAIMLQVGGILFGELMSGRALVSRSPGSYARVPQAGTFSPAEVVTERPVAMVDHKVAPASAEDKPSAAPVVAAAAQPGAAAAAVSELRRADVGPRQAEAGTPLSNLSADIALGRARVIVLAGVEDEADCRLVSEKLAADATARGLSVVTVDAGSGQVSGTAGLTDLASDGSSFGDVVHKVHDGLANVPWGTIRKLERRSMKPLTLIEALSDLYEVVIVSTGRLSLASSLAVFAGIDCRLVLVSRDLEDRLPIEAATEEAEALGFAGAQIVSPPDSAETV
ncbi:MAG: GumC family protein, partial [Devosia sp.]